MITQMNVDKFIAKLLDIANNHKTLYVMGCFGAPLNDKNKKRYTKNNSYNKKTARKEMILSASSDTFGFDCVCLIKGVLWGWSGRLDKTYGGAVYKSNGVPDIGADAMIKKCRSVSTDFYDIDRGEAVWMDGHIGVYIGGGKVVECTPKWKNCVQVTRLEDRKWLKHGFLPYVNYNKAEEEESKDVFGRFFKRNLEG